MIHCAVEENLVAEMVILPVAALYQQLSDEDPPISSIMVIDKSFLFSGIVILKTTSLSNNILFVAVISSIFIRLSNLELYNQLLI